MTRMRFGGKAGVRRPHCTTTRHFTDATCNMCYYRLEQVWQTGCSNSYEAQTGFALGMFFGRSIGMDQCTSFQLFDSSLAIYQHSRDASLKKGDHVQLAPSPLASSTLQHFASFDVAVSSKTFVRARLFANTVNGSLRLLHALQPLSLP